MKLLEKRNIVFLMAIFLLFMMVSSVNAIDIEDAVVDEEQVIEDLNLISSDTSEEISVGNAGSDNSVLYPEGDDSLSTSDADEKLSSELSSAGDSVVSPKDTKEKLSMDMTVDDSSQNVLEASAEEEVLGATPIYVGPSRTIKTINDALNQLTSGTTDYEIIIDSGTYSHTSTMNLGGNYRNFRSLVIRAADGADVTISGNNQHRIFNVQRQNVAIKGINFVNGSGTGGALEISTSHISVDDCSFINCGAKTTSLQSGVLGGAVHVASGGNYHDINITNSNFERNLAQVGGCIRTESGTYDVIVKDCNFTNNTATKHGGVTCFYGYGVTVENCMVVNNTASSDGGLHFHTANSTVKNCTFIGNVADGKGIGDGYGNGYGGALGLVYDTKQPGVTIEDCTFINNTAAADGGAINIQGDGGNAKIDNCTFEGNDATDGGAIKIKGSNTTITDSTFANNTARNTSGGAIEITGPNTHLTNITVENNTANTNGGGIFVNGINTTITDSKINGNDAGVNGGGVYILGSNTTINNTSFDSNNALPAEDNMDEGLGGSLYVAGNNSLIINSNFTNNTGRNGSAIYVNPTNPSNVNNITNCDFKENQAWSYWMPIVYNETHVEVNITGGNNILNAIYNNGPIDSIYINGEHPVEGWENSDGGRLVYQDVREAYQDIEVTIYDTQGHIVYDKTHKTGLGGNVTFELSQHTESDAWFFVLATHIEDTYYKEILNGTACDLQPNVTVSNVTMYEGNSSAQPVIVILADESAHTITIRGNITVYVRDNGNDILIANGSTKTGFFAFNETTVFKTMSPGEYPIIAKFTYVDRVRDIHGRWINVTKTINGTGKLTILEYKWDLTKDIVEVNGVPYTEGMVIHVNDNVTFKITVGNKVDANITDLKITDLDSDNLTYVKYANGTENLGWDFAGNGVWNLANLPANQNSSLLVTFEVINNGTSINVANASILNGFKNKSANASLSAVYTVNLDITKVANHDEVLVGDNVVFTITVTNKGKNDATNTTITDKLNIEAFDYVSCSEGGVEKDGVVTWNVGTLAPGKQAIVTVTVTVKEPGTFNNTAAVVCDQNKTETNDTTEIKAKSVILNITKVADSNNVLVGENLVFTITVTNNGTANATGVVITDKLDTDAFEYVSSTAGGVEKDGVVTWNVDNIGPDGKVIVTVTVTTKKTGTFNNTASVVCAENDTKVNATAKVKVDSVVLNITKKAELNEYYVGDEVIYTITVTNKGTATATDTNITDVLNTTVFEYVRSSEGGKYKDGVVTWNVGNIAPNDYVTVLVTVIVKEPGTFNNTAAVICKENKTKTNDTTNITAKTLVIMDITKEATEYELVVGETVSFHINVTNKGETNATDVVIYDILPEEFEYIGGADSYDESTRNITWNINKLGKGNSTTVTFIAKAISDGKITNTAHTFAKENKTDVNASTDVITIHPNVVLDITKVSNVTEVVIGDLIEFTITVTNNGLSKATDVRIWDILPEGFKYISGADSYDESTRNLTWTIEKLASNGGKANVTFIAQAVKFGDYVNVAFANAKENDTPVDNSTDKITVKKLNLIITINNYVTYPGGEVTVEITVVDEKNNPFTGTLNIEVADPVSTDSLPVHTVGASELGAYTTTADINNGKGSFTYSVPEDAEPGTSYEVTGSTEESEDYYAAEGTGYIDVEKYKTTTTVSNASGAPGEKVTLDVEVTTEDGEPFNGEVTVNGPDGFNTTVTIKDGKGSFDWTIPEDAENGTQYEFTATFDGNSKYYGSNGTAIVDVLTEDEEPEDEPEEPEEPEEEPDEPEEPEEPEEEPDEPVEENTVQPAPMLKTGNPLIVLLVAMMFLGLGLKRKEDE